MARGISLHIGLNHVDPAHYQGWDGALVACHADSEDMEAIAKGAGFDTTLVQSAAATRSTVISAIERAAQGLESGDIFFISYAGHGGRVPDKNHDEADRMDETWCLYDGELIDDELAVLWAGFAQGVRVLVVSDSCHSGTVTRAVIDESQLDPLGMRRRFMPRDVALRVYRANRDFYDEIAAELPPAAPAIAASVRLISGCQDNQYSNDGDFNGLFTGTLLRVWNDGRFEGNYRELHQQILALMPAWQSPNHDVIGSYDTDYDAQRPFRI
jgi:hypothetical protein